MDLTSRSIQRFSLMAPQQPMNPSTMMMTPMAMSRSMPGTTSFVICKHKPMDVSLDDVQCSQVLCLNHFAHEWSFIYLVSILAHFEVDGYTKNDASTYLESKTMFLQVDSITRKIQFPSHLSKAVTLNDETLLPSSVWHWQLQKAHHPRKFSLATWSVQQLS